MKKIAYRGDLFLNLTQLILCGMMFASTVIGFIGNLVKNPSFFGLSMWFVFAVGAYIILRIVWREYKNEK
ncbi:MAG: hypothetical protein IJ550_02270 [Bacteroidaceae bacterium]|nr:hypothetical protein [Bacteroidaceae bacterium]